MKLGKAKNKTEKTTTKNKPSLCLFLTSK